MKRLLAAALAALLLCGPAMAAGNEGALREFEIIRQAEVDMDLDGDGTPERVSWDLTYPDEYEEGFRLTVTMANGAQAVYEPEFDLYIQGVYAADLDGDGRVELLISGDEASDDYLTYSLRLVNGMLEPMLFADANRGENHGGYYKNGYGMVTGLDGNRLTLCGSQDVLGTWFAQRVYTLADTGIYEFADDGEWVRDMEGIDLEDPELWANDYPTLTVIRDLPCADANGNAARLPAGTQLLITGSDKQTFARFVTRDGQTGTLEISPDFDRGWGMLVNGENEESWFRMIPYAD